MWLPSLESLILPLLVLASAYIASSEVALFSLSKFQIRVIRENIPNAFTHIQKLLSDPPGLLITTLMINEILNVSISNILVRMTRDNWNFIDNKLGLPEWLAVGITSVLITAPITLIFCDMLPKYTGIRMNHIIAPVTCGTMHWAYRLFLPLRWISKMIVLAFSGKSAPEPSSGDLDIKEEEFIQLAEEGARQGNIKQSELDLIKSVFDLDDRKIIEIMTPIDEVYSLPAHLRLTEAIIKLGKQRYNRIPIIETGSKKIIGILYSKDLFVAQLKSDFTQKTIDSLMMPPTYAPETMQLNTLFRNMKNQNAHMAIVKSRNGGDLGIVTMHDLLDVIFESINEGAQDDSWYL